MLRTLISHRTPDPEGVNELLTGVFCANDVTSGVCVSVRRGVRLASFRLPPLVVREEVHVQEIHEIYVHVKVAATKS